MRSGSYVLAYVAVLQLGRVTTFEKWLTAVESKELKIEFIGVPLESLIYIQEKFILYNRTDR